MRKGASCKMLGVRRCPLWELGTSSHFARVSGRGMYGDGLDLGRQLRLSVPHDDCPFVLDEATSFLCGQRDHERT